MRGVDSAFGTLSLTLKTRWAGDYHHYFGVVRFILLFSRLGRSRRPYQGMRISYITDM